MTFLNPTQSPARSLGHSAATVARRIADVLAGLADSYRRYRVFRETCDSLDGLTDRELADMGIRRFEINAVASRAAFTDN